MAEQQKLNHRYAYNTAFPYVSNGTVVSKEPRYISGSNDILTSIRGYAERRPGFAPHTSDTFTTEIKRIFTWENWAGSFYVFVNEVTTDSKVYVSKDGGAFSLILTASSSTEPFDFVVSNDNVFMSNGKDGPWRYTGSGAIQAWGIGTSPMILGAYTTGQPTTATAGSGSFTAAFGFKYVFTYGNSTSGHISSASNPSAPTGAFSSKATVDVTGPRSTDTQVDKIHVYRTTDGGDGIFYECSGSPIANPGAGDWTFNDSTADANLSTARAPIGEDRSTATDPTPTGVNDPAPIGYKGPVWFANRIWMYQNNQVIFSAWEELNTTRDGGIEEQAFPPTNKIAFPSSVKGLKATQEALMIFTANQITIITGDGLDTFTKAGVLENMGVQNRACITTLGRSVAFLDRGDIVRVTDGYQTTDISVPIRPDLVGITHATASLAYHSDGKNQWLLLGDGTNGKIYVYDMDLNQWMPPWTLAHRAIHSGELTAGAVELFIGSHDNIKVLKMTPTAYQDDSSNFAANIVSSLFDIVPDSDPGLLSDVEYITYESNAVEPTTVKILYDEDPTSGTFETLSGGIAPPKRTNTGTALVEKWFYDRDDSARRVSVQFNWAAANSNFILYAFDIAFFGLEPARRV